MTTQRDGRPPSFGGQSLELRGLAAPAPLVRALEAVDALAAGACIELLTWQMPYPLIELLGDRGFVVAAERRDDGAARLLVERPAAQAR